MSIGILTTNTASIATSPTCAHAAVTSTGRTGAWGAVAVLHDNWLFSYTVPSDPDSRSRKASGVHEEVLDAWSVISPFSATDPWYGLLPSAEFRGAALRKGALAFSGVLAPLAGGGEGVAATPVTDRRRLGGFAMTVQTVDDMQPIRRTTHVA